MNQAATEDAIRNADNSKDFRVPSGDSMGKVVGGQEYLTVFDGLTGKAVHTVFYNPNRNAQYGGEADGSIVIIESTNSVDGTLTLTNSSGQPDGPFTYARSDDGSKYYCTMTADGQIGFCGAHPYIGAI